MVSPLNRLKTRTYLTLGLAASHRPLEHITLPASKTPYPDVASVQGVAWRKLQQHTQAVFVNSTNQLELELLAPETCM
jgi:hypothetical protein